jgi:hypothetical protein
VKRLPKFWTTKVPSILTLSVPSSFTKNRRPNKIVKTKRRPQISSFTPVVSLLFTILFVGSHVVTTIWHTRVVQFWRPLQAAQFPLQHILLFIQIAKLFCTAKAILCRVLDRLNTRPIDDCSIFARSKDKPGAKNVRSFGWLSGILKICFYRVSHGKRGVPFILLRI